VYHNHHAGGNFTTPGTASLLTGTFPWTHRALGYYDNVEESFINKNIFSAFPNHYRLAYTHNPVANRFLTQFSGQMEDHVPLGKLFLTNDDFIYALFRKDEDMATVSWVRTTKSKDEGYAYSLFLARLFEKQRERMISELRPQFPGGIPHIATDDYFLLEDGINWLGDTLSGLPQPFLGYFHFWPPHDPYNTEQKFFGHFNEDGFWPVSKPLDMFSKKEDARVEFILRKRTNYDEYILYVDQEFGRLMDRLDASGMLEDAWVVLTSDHGEMFERGIYGHWTPVLYQPVIQTPLMIFEPGQKSRQDIYTNTSAVDLLPTLLHVTGQKPAGWNEGSVMPPFVQNYNPERNIYVVQSLHGERNLPLTEVTVALIKGDHKLMYFTGYKELGDKERIELYDLKHDPEELNDLASSKPKTTSELLNELKQKLKGVNEPYLNKD
jgi:arylsulfatase A-like enzyme